MIKHRIKYRMENKIGCRTEHRIEHRTEYRIEFDRKESTKEVECLAVDRHETILGLIGMCVENFKLRVELACLRWDRQVHRGVSAFLCEYERQFESITGA